MFRIVCDSNYFKEATILFDSTQVKAGGLIKETNNSRAKKFNILRFLVESECKFPLPAYDGGRMNSVVCCCWLYFVVLVVVSFW